MHKSILAVAIFASFSAISLQANALDIDPAEQAQQIIEEALADECNLDIEDIRDSDLEETRDSDLEETDACDFGAVLSKAIAENPELADSILAAAITLLGADSPLIGDLLRAAIDSGLDGDSVTAIAIANGVDATIASEDTAAGPNPGDGLGNTGTTITPNRGPGNGGGGGGISGNQ